MPVAIPIEKGVVTGDLLTGGEILHCNLLVGVLASLKQNISTDARGITGVIHETSGDIEGAHSSVPHGVHRRDIDLFHYSTDKDPGPICATVVRNVQLLSAVDHLSCT